MKFTPKHAIESNILEIFIEIYIIHIYKCFIFKLNQQKQQQQLQPPK